MSALHAAPLAVDVAVGILRRPDGRILLCQRPPHKPWPLEWEFPGGKLEPGETHIDALVRELHEELSIRATVGLLLHRETANYPDGTLFAVAYHLVESWNGSVQNLEFASLRWVSIDELNDLPVLQGNAQVCGRLTTEGIDGMLTDSRR